MYTLEDAIEDLRGTYCPNCHEYKGMAFDEENEEYYCIFCE